MGVSNGGEPKVEVLSVGCEFHTHGGLEEVKGFQDVVLMELSWHITRTD